MKRIRYVIVFALVLMIVICAVIFILYRNKFVYLSAYIPFLERSHIKLVNKNSQVSNLFYGESVDMSQLLPTSLHYVKNSKGEDLIDIAHHLGINMFRITNSQRSFNDGKDSIYTKAQWNQVLNKMQQNGIKAIILIETASNKPDYYFPNIKPIYLNLVNQYILDSGVLDNSDVYALDLKNEPVINVGNVLYITKAASLIRSRYPKVKLTVGWWSVDSMKKDNIGKEIYVWDDYKAGKSLEDIVDFYSVHLYGFDSKMLGLYPDPYTFTNVYISSVRAGLKTNKPILIEEFGVGNGDKITDQSTLGSKEIQVNTYAGVYQEVKDNTNTENLLGSIAYEFYPRDINTNGWNILDNNGDYLYPAAYVLQKYATGNSDISIDFSSKTAPNDYILTNTNESVVQAVNVNDIIGLQLSLNNNYHYAAVIDNPTSVSQTEQLTYVRDIGKFDAVFHALKSGTTAIRVYRKDGDIEEFKATLIINP